MPRLSEGTGYTLRFDAMEATPPAENLAVASLLIEAGFCFITYYTVSVSSILHT